MMASQARLTDAEKLLMHAWRGCAEQWRDEARRRFEGEVIEGVERATKAAAGAMETMHESLVSAKVACA